MESTQKAIQDPDLKKIIKTAMKGRTPDEKVKAWKSTENFLKLQGLLEEAIATSSSVVELGEGDYSADIVIITATPMTKEEKTLLRAILDAIDIQERDVYFTVKSPWSYKELEILRPIVAVQFGTESTADPFGFTELFEDTKMLLTYHLSSLLDPVEGQGFKNEVWKDLKILMKYYDQVREETA